MLSKTGLNDEKRPEHESLPQPLMHTCMTEYGYYDYAHFSKDFKKSLGITPAEYKKWILRAFEQRKQSKNVVFLQDE
ncbi:MULTISPECIES: AraC family transcriptional regulator [unclassified Paenibacillus]|uniref:helix-turn-helix domain-containing protein n=1 Tax=unclassified Paenibacillus TaxID=185978 RepID=UPI0027D80DFC|nr:MULTISPECIES: hypothetical protein [unclassified Paenibacillus]